METIQEKNYDVVIYEIDTRKVDTIAGSRMSLSKGFYNAIKRQETVDGRLNEHFNTAIVEHAKYKEGDVLPKNP